MPGRTDELRTAFASLNGKLKIGVGRELTTTSRIFTLLRQAIAELVLRPRETLSEKQLAMILGVSKTPIREALIRLGAEGLVLTLPRSGSFVAPIVACDLFEAMIIRQALETTAVRLATRKLDRPGRFLLKQAMRRQHKALAEENASAFHRADDELHRAIVSLSGVERLATVLEPVRLTLNRVRHLAAPVAGRMQMLTAQHQLIVDAMLAGDAEAAVLAMQAHLEALSPFIEALLRDRPELFASRRDAARRDSSRL